MYKDRRITYDRAQRAHFEYREHLNTRKKVYLRASDERDSLLSGDPREFKVRIVERLSEIEKSLSRSGGGGGTEKDEH